MSASTTYDSQFNSISTKTSCRVYHCEIGDNNCSQDSPSEVTEYFDYNIDTSATKLIANMTNQETPNSNACLPLEDCNLLILDVKELWRKYLIK